MKRCPFGWPFGYGPIEGTLMILFLILFVLPVTIICLCVECGVKEAWRTMRDL